MNLDAELVQSPPTCPQCKQELTKFHEKVITFKFGIVAQLLWCPNEACRALLSIQYLGPAPPEQPRVQVPPASFNPSDFGKG